MERYQFVAEHCRQWPVEEMCQVLEVSRSGFYDWQGRAESPRAVAQRHLDAAIKKAYHASKGRSGSPKIAFSLQNQGWSVSKNRVARRMRKLELRSIVSRRFRVTTTDSRHEEPIAPNLLKRGFTVAGPNQVWVGDITYLPTRQGWIYLAVFIDLYSRRVVGWAVSTSLSQEVVLKALQQALTRRRPPRGLIVHTDRGGQYAAQAFRSLLQRHGLVQSMSRKGNCWDHAVAESFFHLLKTELVYHARWEDHLDSYHDLFEYLEIFYNRERFHSTLGYLTPAQFEQHSHKLCA
ncbi:MAG: IS3 family transposase [Candidatus Handelsmanbacteria bacterium]|nr:IS3 family transposase [Candidatus Handelsmanbacteria bacterium]